MTDPASSRPYKLEWLESFAAFAETLSFTRAARDRHISQPALHVQVAKLADALGVPLYRRDGSRISLTAQGLTVLRYAREMRDRARDLSDELSAGEIERPVVLAAGEGSLMYVLAAGIAAFVSRRSGALRLLTRDAPSTIAAVEQGEAQLGVAPLRDAPPSLERFALTDMPQMGVFPSTHRLARRARVRLRDLDGERLVAPTHGRPQRQTIDGALLDAGARCEIAVEAVGWEPTVHFVKLGMGIAVVNACCRLPAGLVARELDELPRVHYALVHRRGAARSGGAADLRETLLRHATSWRHARDSAWSRRAAGRSAAGRSGR
jgi:DNA-binding transcriptional LysR family regulator